MKRTGQRRRASQGGRVSHHTSQPTSRGAYQDTRAWLLKQHGPVCAYCGKRGNTRGMTLDHVTPRRGQEAYDRRDNLVLACKACNGAKMDKPILAFLLGDRTRAARLLRYGSHLSDGLIQLAEELAGPLGGYSAAVRTAEESPYKD
jgi:5-methylcytosine-specific restriction endonuclease McrA